MTPQEKAKELFKKYSVYNLDNGEQWYIANNFAKKCALIAVDEIINSNPHSNPFNTEVYSTMDYWQEVKQEIKKL